MTASPASPSASGTVELLIRIWSQSEVVAPPPPPAWTDGTHLVRMIRQIVLLGGGVPDVAFTQFLRAHFTDEFRAVNTARRLQALITGFASVAGQPIVAASIAILCSTSSLQNADRESQSSALRAYVQQRAHPAQILFSCPRHSPSTLPSTLRVQRLDTLTVASSKDLELYELLWAYKDQTAAAAVQARARTAKQRQTATLPLPPTPTAPTASPAPALSQRALSFLTAIKDQGADIFARLSTLYRQRQSFFSWPSRASLAALLRSRPAQLAGGGFCVAALAIFLLVHHRSSTPAPTPTTVPSQTPAATRPAPPPVITEKPLANTATPTNKPRKPEPPKQARAEEDKPARGRGDLSPEQTRQVLNRGQAELDRGCYTKAIGYYRRVLEDDPRNASAGSGIEKARTRMRLSGDDPQGHCQ